MIEKEEVLESGLLTFDQLPARPEEGQGVDGDQEDEDEDVGQRRGEKRDHFADEDGTDVAVQEWSAHQKGNENKNGDDSQEGHDEWRLRGLIRRPE